LKIPGIWSLFLYPLKAGAKPIRFSHLIVLAAALSLVMFAAVSLTDFKSGQGSPMHDSDRLTPMSGKSVSIENDNLKVTFDQGSGALTGFIFKKTGWNLQQRPELGESFRMFVPIPERDYSPVLGARNRLVSYKKSADGQSIVLVWDNLQSEYAGKLNITLTGTVRIEDSQARFDLKVQNNSGFSIHTVSWPIIGALNRPEGERKLATSFMDYGNLASRSLYPRFDGNPGYFGTNYPLQFIGGRFNLVSAGQQGLYQCGYESSAPDSIHDPTLWEFQLKPGYEDSYMQKAPAMAATSSHPVRISENVVHYPYVAPGQTASLATTVLAPYQGDWHNGVDIFKAWRATWFRRPITPKWATEVNAWQQIQINSSEDDLRTRYRDLPERALQAAQNGISAIQLVGWNKGGQDRGNPFHDTDPRLGTREELKEAIAEIQKSGVHVVLFNKYVWADMSTEAYKNYLYKDMAVDPYGVPYQYHGYNYQTPEQLVGINTRRFGVACMNDPKWLDLSEREFRKTIDLGASGMLYDESSNHGGAMFCFSPYHGHRVPETLFSGDQRLGERFRNIVQHTVGESHYLMSGEDPVDKLALYYSLSYFRIGPGHIPVERYIDPFRPIMIAVTGFDDREMIDRALMYRYIISYEPFNFKGNLDDFPLTLAYGKKVDALRRRYQDHLWNAEFRDTVGANVTVNGRPYRAFTVFQGIKDGRHSVVVVNPTSNLIDATVLLEHPVSRHLVWVSPEDPQPHACNNHVIEVPARSAVVLLEQ
jgi:hypothetical protein